jgi:predicted metal-dependent hydrolase
MANSFGLHWMGYAQAARMEWQTVGLVLEQLELEFDENAPYSFVRSHRARRYILRVLADGSVCVTIPRRGSLRAAHDFAQSQTDWIRRQRQRRLTERDQHPTWQPGSTILVRGQPLALLVRQEGARYTLCFGDETIALSDGPTHLRPLVERYLQRIAATELVHRTRELASQWSAPLRRVSIRNQRSRWGSCSLRGTISLNWRLIQTPPFVQDYLILHELAHFEHPNHSKRFWRRVLELCPNYREAEHWLKQHSWLLRHGT